MVVKVKLPSAQLEQGTEPVCHEDQAAPIVGKEVEWKEEGTVNDGHTEAEPKGTAYQPAEGKVPTPESECGDSGACGLGTQEEPDSSSGDGTSGTGDESQLTIPDLPDSPPVEAYGDDLPWHDDDDGADAGAPPPPVGEPEAEQAEGDQQAAPEPTAEETEAEEETLTEDETAELPADEPAQEKAVMTTDKQMVSHGETVSHDHETETVPVSTGHLQAEELAKVRYSCGFTKNIGEFNSFRADVAIELPCKATSEAIDDAYQYAVNLVDTKLQALYDQAGTVEHVEPPQASNVPDLPMAPPPPPA